MTRNKFKMVESKRELAEVIASKKRTEAEKLRAESRKLSKLRFKREVENVKRNMERRDGVYRSMVMGDVIREARKGGRMSCDMAQLVS